VIRARDGTVLIVTTDPIAFIPALGPKDSAWMSAHLLATDLATSGVEPLYAVFDFNLPPKMSDSEFEKYWNALHESLSKLGIAIVAGHTGKFEGCDYTIIGGGMMMSFASESNYITPGMATPGDKIILTKGAGISTTALFARVFPEKVESTFGKSFLERAQKYFSQISAVNECCILSSKIGLGNNGVSAMHDATEGGVISAIWEIGLASNCGFFVSVDDIIVSEETSSICHLFGVDPFRTLSEGSLVVTIRPSKADLVVETLRKNGIPSSIIGEMKPKPYGREFIHKGRVVKIKYPFQDPYWNAYWKAIRAGWV
jgi:hydrogenase expression/formation protein HypE